jgi:hypothetical protein
MHFWPRGPSWPVSIPDDQYAPTMVSPCPDEQALVRSRIRYAIEIVDFRASRPSRAHKAGWPAWRSTQEIPRLLYEYLSADRTGTKQCTKVRETHSRLEDLRAGISAWHQRCAVFALVMCVVYVCCSPAMERSLMPCTLSWNALIQLECAHPVPIIWCTPYGAHVAMSNPQSFQARSWHYCTSCSPPTDTLCDCATLPVSACRLMRN